MNALRELDIAAPLSHAANLQYRNIKIRFHLQLKQHFPIDLHYKRDFFCYQIENKNKQTNEQKSSACVKQVILTMCSKKSGKKCKCIYSHPLSINL